ncbi:hypothetical protein [Zavarzinella formosa]|uniref:hypothetical protein n=1 Tax=Zavarzinella formosa TaxID=360055 RepID=UPI0002F83448|nr:hypothetical protein [Zavarzinella formosa]
MPDNELAIAYSLDANGEPVRGAEYLRLVELMKSGWILVDLKKAHSEGAMTYTATLRRPMIFNLGSFERDGDTGG